MATLAEILDVSVLRAHSVRIRSTHVQHPDTGACMVCPWWVWPCPQVLAALRTMRWCARRVGEIQDDLDQRTGVQTAAPPTGVPTAVPERRLTLVAAA